VYVFFWVSYVTAQCDGEGQISDNSTPALCCTPEYMDCAGICYGAHMWDNVLPISNCCFPDQMDCVGECFGQHIFDEQADPACCLTEYIDCSGICFGGNIYDSETGECCDAWQADCAGVCDGSSVFDASIPPQCCLLEMMNEDGICS